MLLVCFDSWLQFIFLLCHFLNAVQGSFGSCIEGNWKVVQRNYLHLPVFAFKCTVCWFYFQTGSGVGVMLLTGPDDNVRCYYCDGGLKNWQPTDEPWAEHKRWFPRCPHLQVQRLCVPLMCEFLPVLVLSLLPLNNIQTPMQNMLMPLVCYGGGLA